MEAIKSPLKIRLQVLKAKKYFVPFLAPRHSSYRVMQKDALKVSKGLIYRGNEY